MINHAFFDSFNPNDFKLIADEHADTWQASRTDSRGRTTAAKPPTAAAFTKLESKSIKVTFDNILDRVKEKSYISFNKIDIRNLMDATPSKDNIYKAIPVCCKSWLCKDCRKQKGHALRERLIKQAEKIKVPRLYTITANRAWHDSPKAFYKYVMNEKFIARLLTKEMGIRRWVWIMEAQEKSGDGWPHWHILLDIGDLPAMWFNKATQKAQEEPPANKDGWVYIPHYFDLNKARRLLSKWEVGKQCVLSKRHRDLKNPEHAICYMTKYLIKSPRRGFPQWILKTPRVKFYALSREFNRKSESVETKEEKKPSLKRKNNKARKPVERVAECRKKVLFSIFDSVKNRFVFSRPMWGLKASIQHMPEALCIQEYSPKSQSYFPTWGFKDLQGLIKFEDIWNKSENLELLIKSINNKQQELLTQWGAA